jgi:hypothetical protein
VFGGISDQPIFENLTTVKSKSPPKEQPKKGHKQDEQPTRVPISRLSQILQFCEEKSVVKIQKRKSKEIASKKSEPLNSNSELY